MVKLNALTEIDVFILKSLKDSKRPPTYSGLLRASTYSQKGLSDHLNMLEQAGVIERIQNPDSLREKHDGKLWKVKTTYYIAIEGSNFELPAFELLPKNITNVTNSTMDTNVTIDTKDREKSSKECNVCNDFNEKPQLTQEENEILEAERYNGK